MVKGQPSHPGELLPMVFVCRRARHPLTIYIFNVLKITVPITPNITESKQKVDPNYTFWVYSMFTPGLPRVTQTGHRE